MSLIKQIKQFINGTWLDLDEAYLPIPEGYKFGHTGGYNDFFICNQSGKMESAKIAFGTHGLNINQGYLGIVPPSNNTIKAQSATYNPITPSTLSYATVIGLTENKLALTDEEKYLAQAWLGAVGKTEYATNSTPGTVIVGGPTFGLYITEYGLLTVHGAFLTDIDEKKEGYRPITPNRLDHAVKVGVTTNTEVLTDEEKYLATTWLGAVKHADTPTGYAAVYAIDREGNDITVSYSPQISSWALAQRGANGTLFVGAPVEDNHATTKKYVNENYVRITSTYIEPSFFNKYF